jgi:hypothetical protein
MFGAPSLISPLTLLPRTNARGTHDLCAFAAAGGEQHRDGDHDDRLISQAFHHGHPLQRQFHPLPPWHVQLSLPYGQGKVPVALGSVHALPFAGSKSGQVMQNQAVSAPLLRHPHVAPG